MYNHYHLLVVPLVLATAACAHPGPVSGQQHVALPSVAHDVAATADESAISCQVRSTVSETGERDVGKIYSACLDELRLHGPEADLHGRAIVAEWWQLVRRGRASERYFRRKRDELGKLVARDSLSHQVSPQHETLLAMKRMLGEEGPDTAPAPRLERFWEERLVTWGDRRMYSAIMADWYLLEELTRRRLRRVRTSMHYVDANVGHDVRLKHLARSAWVLVDTALDFGEFDKAERAAELVLQADQSFATVEALIVAIAPGGREVGEAFLAEVGRWLPEPDRSKARRVLDQALRRVDGVG